MADVSMLDAVITGDNILAAHHNHQNTAITNVNTALVAATGFGPANLDIREDFITDIVGFGQYNWANAAGGGTTGRGTTPVSNAHPGVLDMSNGTTGSNHILNLPATILLGGGILTYQFGIYIPTLSVTNTYLHTYGLNDLGWGILPQNGVFFEYDAATSANWRYRCLKTSTGTATTSTTAVATGWNYGTCVINAAASSASFSMNGVSLGAAITTNIPNTIALAPAFTMRGVGGSPAGVVFGLDYFYLQQALTATR